MPFYWTTWFLKAPQNHPDIPKRVKLPGADPTDQLGSTEPELTFENLLMARMGKSWDWALDLWNRNP